MQVYLSLPPNVRFYNRILKYESNTSLCFTSNVWVGSSSHTYHALTSPSERTDDTPTFLFLLVELTSMSDGPVG